jgi:AraC family transcriptional regulator of arabinose operon
MKKEYARWREHGAPGWLLVYTLKGMGRFGHRRGDLNVDTGDLVLLAPRTPNDYGLEGTLKRWDLLWAYFFPRPNWHALLRWPEVAPGLMQICLDLGKVRSEIVGQMMECHRLNMSPRRHKELFAMNALERVLLSCDDLNSNSECARFDPRVFRAMEFLCENVGNRVTLTGIAKYCGISCSRLSHLFRSHSGQTPRQFLERERISRARQLLELTQDSVTNIASEAGFTDVFHFSRRFKLHTGLSPRMYRQNRVASSQ